MTRKAILNIFASLLLLPIVACNNSSNQDQQPSQAERERLEREYQKSIQQLRKMTEGTTETLDGKTPPHQPQKHPMPPTPTPTVNERK
jgi:hypothetical protein